MKNGVTPKWENVAHNKNLATEVSFMTLACVWRVPCQGSTPCLDTTVAVVNVSSHFLSDSCCVPFI